MIIRREPVTYKHPVKVFVPVFQKDFDEDGELLYSPSFVYSYADATDDEQMAWVGNPAFVMELNGEFNATTKPLVIADDE